MVFRRHPLKRFRDGLDRLDRLLSECLDRRDGVDEIFAESLRETDHLILMASNPFPKLRHRLVDSLQSGDATGANATVIPFCSSFQRFSRDCVDAIKCCISAVLPL